MAQDDSRDPLGQDAERTIRRRKNLSKRLRFEVFKRDGFRCFYCGANPNQAVLRVDHVIPVAKGGSDDPANLVTSCHDCNGGKSDIPLEQRRLPTAMDPEMVREHAEQIRAYLDAQKQVLDAKDEVIEAVLDEWRRAFGGGPPPASLRNALGRAVVDFDLSSLAEAIRIVATNSELGAHQDDTYDRQVDRARYFFGILKRARENGGQIHGARQPPAPQPANPVEPPRPAEVEGVDPKMPVHTIKALRVSSALGYMLDAIEREKLTSTHLRLLATLVACAFEGRANVDVYDDHTDYGYEERTRGVARDVSLREIEQLEHAGLVLVAWKGEFEGRASFEISLPENFTGAFNLRGDTMPPDVSYGSGPVARWVTRDCQIRLGGGEDGEG